MIFQNELPTLLHRLWGHVSPRRRKQFWFVLGLSFVCAFADVVSLGAVIPFLAVLTAPEDIYSYPFVGRAAQLVGIDSPEGLLLPLTLAFGIAAAAAAIMRITFAWAETRFTYGNAHDLGAELYRRTLHQPYQVHVGRNSSQVISGITQKVSATVAGVLGPLLSLINGVTIVAVITVSLVIIDPFIATAAALGFGSSYAIVAWACRQRVLRNSRAISREHPRVIQSLQEGLGGIRDVLLDGTQSLYCDAFRQSDYTLRRAQASNALVSTAPRFAMEGLGMVLLACLAYALHGTEGGMTNALPILGALALGAQRLLPALQQTYAAWTAINGNRHILASTLDLLDQPLPPGATEPTPPPLDFEDSIRFQRVSFRYGDGLPWVLKDLDLTIRKGQRVGIVGSTGSGKSTALDVLMALLPPTEGELLVDGEPIQGARARAWQRTIAHVPQAIYLSDASFAENIAFGVRRRDIDMERVRQAARQAQIAGFIESGKEGYDAVVGERGVRLSGGQRQRIAIARALYKKASVLVFDEATSALDNETERSVMESIEALDRELTVILIAHRLTTVRRCDVIIEIEQGRVAAAGTYDELLAHSESFKRVATGLD